jgi:hypothetical protein
VLSAPCTTAGRPPVTARARLARFREGGIHFRGWSRVVTPGRVEELRSSSNKNSVLYESPPEKLIVEGVSVQPNDPSLNMNAEESQHQSESGGTNFRDAKSGSAQRDSISIAGHNFANVRARGDIVGGNKTKKTAVNLGAVAVIIGIIIGLYFGVQYIIAGASPSPDVPNSQAAAPPESTEEVSPQVTLVGAWSGACAARRVQLRFGLDSSFELSTTPRDRNGDLRGTYEVRSISEMRKSGGVGDPNDPTYKTLGTDSILLLNYLDEGKMTGQGHPYILSGDSLKLMMFGSSPDCGNFRRR